MWSIISPLIVPLGVSAEKYTETPFSPSVGVWNGFLNHLNIVECSNFGNIPATLLLTVRESSGNVLGNRTLLLNAFGSLHTVLNEFDIVDSYGTYQLELVDNSLSLNNKIRCLTAIYRSAPSKAPKAVDYAFAIPVTKPLKGTTFGIYNSINPAGKDLPTFNWLSVYNPGSSPFSATILTYNFDGSGNGPLAVNDLAPGARVDLPLGHNSFDGNGQTVGIYKIIPQISNAPYGAFLTRYKRKDFHDFVFAFPLLALNAYSDSGNLSASTMNPATNWGEVANVTNREVEVVVQIRNRDGIVIHRETRLIPAFQQTHILLNNYIGEANIGSFRVFSENSADRLIVQSIFYGHLPDTLDKVEWAYATQANGAVAIEGNKLVTSINTFMGMYNWLNIMDSTTVPFTVDYSILTQEGEISNQGNLALVASGSYDLGIHEAIGANFVGSVSVLSKVKGSAFSTQVLRVFPHKSGNIGYVMPIPSYLTSQEETTEGDSNDSGVDSGESGSGVITQPSQPHSGPGGDDYTYTDVSKTERGTASAAYFLYEPTSPTPVSAPVVAFLHGYSGVNPGTYGAWISHLVRKGNIVIYPVYQVSLSGIENYTRNSIIALKNALNILRDGTHVSPELNNFALVGHSLGGAIAVNIAATANAQGLPVPKVLMLANAADANVAVSSFPSILQSDLSKIPSDLLLLGVVGNNDTLAGGTLAQHVLSSVPQIPTTNRELITLFSDDYGTVPLLSDHLAPTAFDANFDSGVELSPTQHIDTSNRANAIDFYGYWKWFDALTNTAFYSVNRRYALGNTPEQKSLGRWSDGTQVTPALVSQSEVISNY